MEFDFGSDPHDLAPGPDPDLDGLTTVDASSGGTPVHTDPGDPPVLEPDPEDDGDDGPHATVPDDDNEPRPYGRGIDTDGDGDYDRMLIDVDGDGDYDRVLIDTDGDGDFDIARDYGDERPPGPPGGGHGTPRF